MVFNRSIAAAVLLCLVAAGCRHEDLAYDPQRPRADSLTTRAVPIRSSGNDIPVVGGMAAEGVRPGDFWFLERNARLLWRFQTRGDSGTVERIADLRQFGAGVPVAITAGAEPIILDNAGLLLHVRANGVTPLGRLRVRPAARALAMVRAGPTVLVAQQVTLRTGRPPGFVDELIVMRIDLASFREEELWMEAQTIRSPYTDLLADVGGASAAGDTLYLSRAGPPRVVSIVAQGEGPLRARAETLTMSPRRRISDGERADIARYLQTAVRVPAKQVRSPSIYPALLGALRIPGGWIVRAQSSKGSESLDLYCGSGFRLTLFDDTDDERAYPAATGVLIVKAPSTAGHVGAYVPVEAITNFCSQAAAAAAARDSGRPGFGDMLAAGRNWMGSRLRSNPGR